MSDTADKMKKGTTVTGKVIHFLFFAITVVFLASQAEGAKWVRIGEDMSGNESFYDSESMTVLPGGIIKVWWKMRYSDEGRNLYIQQMKRFGLDAKGYETLSYSRNLTEIDCETREVRIIVVSNYTARYVLDSINVKPQPSEGWEPIVPGTMEEQMYKTVCLPQEKK